jgi:serine/threonine protein kinase
MGISSYSWASEEVRTLDDNNENNQILLTKIDRQLTYRLLEHQHRLDDKNSSSINNVLQDYDKQNKIKSLGEKTVLKRDQNPWDLHKLIDEISSYGRTCVIRCSERATDSIRIIKILDKQNNETDEFNLLNLISHEHIIVILDAFIWKQSFILVTNDYMELCDWICLRHKYNEELIVKILRQIFDAIHYLHFHGIIHLNINPSSVVNENRLAVHIKITDFSCAQQIATIEGHNINKDNLQPNKEYAGRILFFLFLLKKIINNYEYVLAPEVLNDEPCGVQADVWSIGALIATL